MARFTGTTTQRGLGTEHVADKKRLMAALREGEPCWRCGKPMYSWQKLDRDHVIDRVLGGTHGPAVLAHASCNRAAGAKLRNQMKPMAIAAAGRDTVCRICGKPYHYAARMCEVCGLHYHPNGASQRTCGRACGVEMRKRSRIAQGWIPKAQRPKPPRKPGPVESGEREPVGGWPLAEIAYYTCRYCGKPGVTWANKRRGGGRREVCDARACQLARLKANNLRIRRGMTREQADAAMADAVASTAREEGANSRQARDW